MTSKQPGSLPTVCILAGGLGTRLGEKVKSVPKPLIEVAGQPFLFHQIEKLKQYGASRFVICVAYLGKQIEAVVGNGERFGVEITYSYDGPDLLGTGGAVKKALPLLDEDFLLLYGDTYLRVNYADVYSRYLESGLPALMTVLRNDGRWDKSNVIFGDGVVELYDKSVVKPEMHWIDYGLSVLSKQVVAGIEEDSFDLAERLSQLSKQGQLAGYEVDKRFYEIGTPAALEETSRFLSS